MNLNLDVNSPDKVADVLRDAAQRYYDTSSELESSWQDKSAGAPWIKIARILDRAAASIDKTLGPLWKKNPRASGTVRVSRAELDSFAQRWPNSGLRNHRPLTFTFDHRGDLVDIEGETGSENEGAMVALSEDAQNGVIGKFLK